jgi:putative transposase
MDISDKLLDELLKGYSKPEDLNGPNGILKQLTKKLVERAMNAEMDHHLGYAKNSPAGRNSGNSRNGTSKKTIISDQGKTEIDVPRDRNGEFEPQLIKKGQRRWNGFDQQILSMYALGMTTRDIQAHLKDQYGVDVSPDLVSTVTDAVIDEVRQWQNRPLERLYPVVFLDALVVKVRDQGHVVNKAAYLAIGLNRDGIKEVLGLWLESSEGAKLWLKIVNELKSRGLEDMFIACVDGLKGFPEAIEAVFPKTQVQLCIVHMVRNSLRYVSWKTRKSVAEDLKKIYAAPTVTQAETELEAFAQKWDGAYPAISKSWRSNWPRLTTFFGYPPAVRRIIYTTNAIESLNSVLRKATRNRGSFPDDDSAQKLLYLGLRNLAKKWTMPVRDWGEAINQFSIIYEDRF